MATLALFCLVDGESTSRALSVKVPSSDTVGGLKNLIKAQMSPVFDDLTANELKLWRVSHPVIAANKHNPILLSAIDSATELDPTDDLSDVFEEKPPKKTIHIIVQRPPPGLSEADVLAMTLPMIRLLRRADRPPSSTATRFATRRTPTRVSDWTEFISDARLYEADTARAFRNHEITFDDQATYCSENTLTSIYDRNVLSVMKRLQGEDIFFGGHNAGVVVGEPDRVVIRTSGEILLAIEVKTSSVLQTNNLVHQYQRDLASMMLNLAPNRSCTHPIEQIHGYLCVNRLRYGILTTYNQTWLLRRVGDELKVSQAINSWDQDPTLLRCYSYILRLAREQASEPSPTSPSNSPRPSTDSATSIEGDDDSDYHPAIDFGKQNIIHQPVILPTGFTISVGDVHLPEFKWQGLLGSGRTGSVFKAEWRGEMVAAKICDLNQHPELEEEVLTEVAVYETLNSLQSICIPQLLCAGFYKGLFVVATEIVGTPLELDKLDLDKRLRIVEIFSQLHNFSILHGDVRPDNILVRGEEVFLIDFGCSSKTTNKQELDNEM
ncbi:hypothetical protein BGZ65_007980, partial [Modicella reniformis]